MYSCAYMADVRGFAKDLKRSSCALNLAAEDSAFDAFTRDNLKVYGKGLSGIASHLDTA